jgi:hypothetical protein
VRCGRLRRPLPGQPDVGTQASIRKGIRLCSTSGGRVPHSGIAPAIWHSLLYGSVILWPFFPWLRASVSPCRFVRVIRGSAFGGRTRRRGVDASQLNSMAPASRVQRTGPTSRPRLRRTRTRGTRNTKAVRSSFVSARPARAGYTSSIEWFQRALREVDRGSRP